MLTFLAREEVQAVLDARGRIDLERPAGRVLSRGAPPCHTRYPTPPYRPRNVSAMSGDTPVSR